MVNTDIDLLIQQVQSISLNKHVDVSMTCESEELKELQKAIFLLAENMEDMQSFLVGICQGDLSGDVPKRDNVVSCYLKEIHSILKHLIWQTRQVAKGDYQHRVNFLGEFSDNFNKMVEQLEEREICLQEKSSALEQSMSLLKTLLDKQDDMILVVEQETDEIVYVNTSAKNKFYDPEKKQFNCGHTCHFFHNFRESTSNTSFEADFSCSIKRKSLHLKAYPITWSDSEAYAYFITDVTLEKKHKMELENMVYIDALTEIYNRRYCLDMLEQFLQEEIPFSFSLIDLDKLKHVNDTYGHLIGDDYITFVSNVLSENINEQDIVCRIGGDEFAVIWKTGNGLEADIRMQKIESIIKKHHDVFSADISYGVVYVTHHNKLTVKNVLKEADQLMYVMKQEHRHLNEVTEKNTNINFKS